MALITFRGLPAISFIRPLPGVLCVQWGRNDPGMKIRNQVCPIHKGPADQLLAYLTYL